MSAKFKAVSSLDDRVARMSDLRVLVDEVSKLITLQQIQIDDLTNLIASKLPEADLSVVKHGEVSALSLASQGEKNGG